MPAPVRVRNSGPLVRPSMTACTAGRAGRGTGTRAGLSFLPMKVRGRYLAYVCCVEVLYRDNDHAMSSSHAA